MDRLLIERIEGRILVGVIMFVTIMILVGWVAINEPARMAAFEELNRGRSIERGAALFAANCSSCHGVEGLGQAGRAPALNNPHLFGYDFLAPVNGEIALLQRQQADLSSQIEELQQEREALFTEAGAGVSEERLDEISERIPAIDDQVAEFEARIEEIDAELEPMIAEREELVAQLQPAIDAGYLPGIEAAREAGGIEYTNFLAGESSRLAQLGWGGDLNSFVVTTLIHGRPGSAEVWGGNQMAAWSQLAGGSLRMDEINDIANYVLNWDQGDNWALDDLYAVQQFGKLPADSALVSTGDGAESVGTDVDAIVAELENYEGDAERGEALYTGASRTELSQRLGCSACHAGGLQAPDTEENWTTAQDVRINDPENSGHTVESYLIESIVLPDEYIVPTYTSGIMPGNFGDIMGYQDMADVLAYLESFAN